MSAYHSRVNRKHDTTLIIKSDIIKLTKEIQNLNEKLHNLDNPEKIEIYTECDAHTLKCLLDKFKSSLLKDRLEFLEKIGSEQKLKENRFVSISDNDITSSKKYLIRKIDEKTKLIKYKENYLSDKLKKSPVKRSRSVELHKFKKNVKRSSSVI